MAGTVERERGPLRNRRVTDGFSENKGRNAGLRVVFTMWGNESGMVVVVVDAKAGDEVS